MLVLRLRRVGRKNAPVYHLVCAEKSAPVKSGKIVEQLGLFDVTAHPHTFTFEKERVQHWLSFGAQPSETVARMLKKEGFSGMEKFVHFGKQYQKKKKGEAEEEAPSSPKAPVVESAPAPVADGDTAASAA